MRSRVKDWRCCSAGSVGSAGSTGVAVAVAVALAGAGGAWSAGVVLVLALVRWLVVVVVTAVSMHLAHCLPGRVILEGYGQEKCGFAYCV